MHALMKCDDDLCEFGVDIALEVADQQALLDLLRLRRVLGITKSLRRVTTGILEDNPSPTEPRVHLVETFA